MNKNRKKLEKILKMYENDEEMLKYINHMFKNFALYQKTAYHKYDVLKKHLDDDPESYVCVMFPEARFMKTKKRKIPICTFNATMYTKKRNCIARITTK